MNGEKRESISRGSVWVTLAAVAVVAAAYWSSQPRALARNEYLQLAEDFSFQRTALPVVSTKQPQKIRNVHPSLKHFAAWTSFVGGAVSIGDLDGDGLCNDIAYVDTRYDEITICPALVSDTRYTPFVIRWSSDTDDLSVIAPMGTRFGDFNDDGHLDVLVYCWGRSPVLCIQQPPESAETHSLDAADFSTAELVSPSQVWHTSCVTQADFNGDGRVDLLVGNYNPDGARTLDASATGQVEVMMGSWARATNGGTSRIFLKQPADDHRVNFVEAPDPFPGTTGTGWTFAAGAADLDDDLLPELYLVHDFGADSMFHNRSKNGQLQFATLRGQRTLATPRSMIIGMDTFSGMGVDFADLNGDQRMDFIVSNITSDWGLQQSSFVFMHTGDEASMRRGVAPFKNQSESMGLSRAGWAWDTKCGDLNNDGELEVLFATGYLKGKTDRWPELHELGLANEELARLPQVYPKLGLEDDISGHEHNRFFTKSGDRYYDIAPWLKSSRLDEPNLSRGLAFADVDADGRLDLACGNQWEDSFFYHNQSSNENQFIGLRLRLPLDSMHNADQIRVIPGLQPDQERSTAAIGAQVKLSVDSPTGRRAWTAQVDGGNGHSGQRSPDIHCGLGRIADASIDVELRWRDRLGEIRNANVRGLSAGWHTLYLGRD